MLHICVTSVICILYPNKFIIVKKTKAHDNFDYFQGCGVIKETLLIELTYYGRSRKKLEAQNSEWSSYPETFSTTTTSDFLSMQSSKFDSEDEVTPYQSMGMINFNILI